MEIKGFEQTKDKLIKNHKLQFKTIKKLSLFYGNMDKFIQSFE